MTNRFIKLPVSTDSSENKDRYFNPDLITMVQSVDKDKSHTLVWVGLVCLDIELPIKVVFDLILNK